MPSYEFTLSLTAAEFLPFYRGTARHVVVRATTGQKVQLPAAMFRPFVTHDGVHGRFILTCDENNKATDLRRV